MDGGFWLGAADRSVAGSTDASRSYPGNERRELSAEGQQRPPETARLRSADSQGRLPLRPKRAPQGGSQASAPAVPANPWKEDPNCHGMVCFLSARVVYFYFALDCDGCGFFEQFPAIRRSRNSA